MPVIFSQGGIQTTNFTLVLFNESYAQQSGARCMDGSPAGNTEREGDIVVINILQDIILEKDHQQTAPNGYCGFKEVLFPFTFHTSFKDKFSSLLTYFILFYIFFYYLGGACVNTTTCAPRVNTSLGSSLFLPSQPAVSSYSFETQDPQWNPDFHDWNHVFLFYCTSNHSLHFLPFYLPSYCFCFYSCSTLPALSFFSLYIHV